MVRHCDFGAKEAKPLALFKWKWIFLFALTTRKWKWSLFVVTTRAWMEKWEQTAGRFCKLKNDFWCAAELAIYFERTDSTCRELCECLDYCLFLLSTLLASFKSNVKLTSMELHFYKNGPKTKLCNHTQWSMKIWIFLYTTLLVAKKVYWYYIRHLQAKIIWMIWN
jgi:hypothetical protein